MTLESVGIIDIGSNTVRLSVVESSPDGGYRVRHEAKAGLRLASRLEAGGGVLGPEAAEETARVLAGFAADGADWGVGAWIAVGTAAVRSATDGPEFLEHVRRQTGIAARVLSGDEEAHLGLVGALNTLAERDGFAVDIGGASTELTRFENRRRAGGASLALGAVNASARFGLQQRAVRAPGAGLDGLRAWCDAATDGADWLQPIPGGTLVGIGGTARALCKLDRHRRNYPLHATHNYVLDPQEALDLAERLAGLSARERERLPGMAPERADIIAAGAGLLAWAVRRTQPARVIVSGAGLREGLFFSHLLRGQPEPLFPDVLEASVRNVERCCGLPQARGARLAEVAGALWAGLHPGEAGPGGAGLAGLAARLREAGTAVGYYDWEAHTFYVLREARLFGLDHRERLLLAAAAGYDGPGTLREQLQPYVSILQPGDERFGVRLGVVAALAHAVDRSCRGGALPLQVTGLPSVLRVQPAGPPAGALPASLAEDFRKAFGKALGFGAV